MKCLKCGREFAPKSIICNGCGNVFAVNDELKCSKCGKTFSGVYCENCTKVNRGYNQKQRIAVSAVIGIIVGVLIFVFTHEPVEEKNTSYDYTRGYSSDEQEYEEIDKKLNGVWRLAYHTDSMNTGEILYGFSTGGTCEIGMYDDRTNKSTTGESAYKVSDGKIIITGASEFNLDYEYENGNLSLYYSGEKLEKIR